MKGPLSAPLLLAVLTVLAAAHTATAFSKYGRSCKDIGCLSSETCILAEDPCSRFSRDQCGKYPTCVPSSGRSSPTCQDYVCPPTQICQLEDGTPRCVPSETSATHVRPNQNENAGGNGPPPAQPNAPSYPSQPRQPTYPNQPSYPNQPTYPNQPSYSGLYPSLTTSRPAAQGAGYPSTGGQGYSGGAANSGYPGAGNYPQQNYPTNSRYPSQQYPQYPQYPAQGSPGQGYPGQGYPNQGYPNQGYPGQGYPNQGYPGQGYQSGQYPGQKQYGSSATGYGQPSSASNPIVDKITDQLKTLGLFFLLLKYFTDRVLRP